MFFLASDLLSMSFEFIFVNELTCGPRASEK